MGILKSLHSQSTIYLKPVHIFGRDPNIADFILKKDSFSRMHCVIRWQNGLWFLTDESKNGCFINGDRIEQGRSMRLNKGDVFSVGSEREDQWVLTDDDRPKPALVSLESNDHIELQTLNMLPDEKQPECQILQKGQDWFYEKDHESIPINEGFQIKLNNQHWTFYPNHLLDETEFRGRVGEQTPSLSFHVSRNEEHVQLVFEFNGGVFDLGNKTHHYLLLEMARHLLADETDAEKERGWMSNELLLHNMKIDINHLNIQIYRARKDIRKCSHYWGQSLIERRRGEIRLFPCNVTINTE
jgi:hypothetical protein